MVLLFQKWMSPVGKTKISVVIQTLRLNVSADFQYIHNPGELGSKNSEGVDLVLEWGEADNARAFFLHVLYTGVAQV